MILKILRIFLISNGRYATEEFNKPQLSSYSFKKLRIVTFCCNHYVLVHSILVINSYLYEKSLPDKTFCTSDNNDFKQNILAWSYLMVYISRFLTNFRYKLKFKHSIWLSKFSAVVLQLSYSSDQLDFSPITWTLNTF